MRSVFLSICFLLSFLGLSQTTRFVTNLSDNINSSGSLRYQIANANPGDTIRISPSLGTSTIILSNGEISINKSLVIKGYRTSTNIIQVSGGNTNRLFNLSLLSPTDSVVFDSLKFILGKAGKGGVIKISNGKLSLYNSIITNNKADSIQSFGGVIYSDNADVILDNCSFTNNHANSDAIQGFKTRIARGGVLYSDNSDVLIKSCIFSNNFTNGYKHNEACSAQGGVLFCKSGSLIVSSSFFENNYSKALNTSGSNSFGGAIYADSIDLLNSSFLNNYSESDGTSKGGAIFSRWSTQISNTSFIGNKSSSGFTYGGAVYSQGALAITNCSLDKNGILVTKTYTPDNGGAAIYSDSTFLLSNSTLDSNYVLGRSIKGGALTCLGTSTITNSTIRRSNVRFPNSTGISHFYGGALYSEHHLTLENSTIDSNIFSATYQDKNNIREGAAIFIVGQALLKNSNISNNTCYGPTQGAAISAERYSSLKINSCNLMNNKALSTSGNISGGCIYMDQDCQLNIEKTFIIGNKIQTSGNYSCRGGAIFSRIHTPVEISNSTIDSNSVIGNLSIVYGGACSFSASVTIKDCNIGFNSIISDGSLFGGGIYSEQYTGEMFKIENSTIANNHIISKGNVLGGGIYCKRLTLLNSTVAFNSVKSDSMVAKGGGIYSDVDYTVGNVNILNSTIAYNSAQGYRGSFGSGIMNFGVVNINLNKKIFLSNSICALNQGAENLRHHTVNPISNGYNIFGDNFSGLQSTDYIGISNDSLKLDTILRNNGGSTLTLLPLDSSIAVNNGNPNDLTNAQNKPLSGIRDIGAAEVNCNDYIEKTISSCFSYYWLLTDSIYTSSGVLIDTATNSQGCDSVVKLHLYLSGDSTIENITACDAYTWINGITYTKSNNTATTTLTNASGCDSVVTLNLNLTKSDSITENITVCGSYTWIDGQTYSSSSDVFYSLTNSTGCDSVINLKLTILPEHFTVDTIISCDPITWIDGNFYNSTDTITSYSYINSFGCDSIIKLHFIRNPSHMTIDSVNYCEGGFTWINNVTYYSDNDTSSILLSNRFGCDSLVTLNLKFRYADTTFTSTDSTLVATGTNNVSYSWYDCSGQYMSNDSIFFPPSAGSYQLAVTNIWGCADTTSCFFYNPSIGISSFNKDETLIYPNPTSDLINIEFKNQLPDVSVRIINDLGQIMEEFNIHSTRIARISLPPAMGIYFIEIISQNCILNRQKVVKF